MIQIHEEIPYHCTLEMVFSNSCRVIVITPTWKKQMRTDFLSKVIFCNELELQSKDRRNKVLPQLELQSKDRRNKVLPH